jgi:hypothetical protein
MNMDTPKDDKPLDTIIVPNTSTTQLTFTDWFLANGGDDKEAEIEPNNDHTTVITGNEPNNDHTTVITGNDKHNIDDNADGTNYDADNDKSLLTAGGIDTEPDIEPVNNDHTSFITSNDKHIINDTKPDGTKPDPDIDESLLNDGAIDKEPNNETNNDRTKVITDNDNHIINVCADSTKPDTENDDSTDVQDKDSEDEDDAFSDDTDDDDFKHDEGEKVKLSFMKRDYDWEKLMPESFKVKKHATRRIELAPDLIQSGKALSVTDIRRRCRYIGTNPNDAIQLKKSSDFIEDLLKKMKVTIQVIVCKFFMDVATHLSFGIDTSSGICESYDDFSDAVEQVQSAEDKKKVQIIIYLVFDFMKGYQNKIAELVCDRLNVAIVDKSNTNKVTSKKKNFLVRLITYVVNNQRKNINHASEAAIGLHYTITRWGIHLERAKNKYDGRKKKYYYKWMVVFDEVCLYIVFMFYNLCFITTKFLIKP